MSEEVIWYIPYVHRGEFKVHRHKRTFFRGSEQALAKHKELPQTEQEARDAIWPFLRKAKERAKTVAEKIKELEQEHFCSIDYFMDGDTHGIHEDFLSINFTLSGFQFNYALREVFDNE